MIAINKNTTKMDSIGFTAHAKLVNNRDSEIISIIFTKGKLELEGKTIERINVYDNAINIFFKDGRNQFINLMNVTYME